MRGRSLLKEPPGSSICAFCAHRLGAARRHSHVHRRFLQSSRPAWKPPAAGAFLREDTSDPSQTEPSRPSWGRPASSGPVTWGGASIEQAPDASAWSSWMQSASSRDHNGSSKGTESKSALMSDNGNLLPHELRARELLADAQKRQITIHTGPGPESSRAGRPAPYVGAERYGFRERDAIAQSALARKRAQELEAQRKAATGGARPLIRRSFDSKHILGDIDRSPLPPVSTEESNPAPQWTQLRRRVEAVPESTPVPPQPREDPFATARARREEEAKSGRYTPLGSRNIARVSERPRDGVRWGTQFRLQREDTTKIHAPASGDIQPQSGNAASRSHVAAQDTNTWRPLSFRDTQTGPEHEGVQTSEESLRFAYHQDRHLPYESLRRISSRETRRSSQKEGLKHGISPGRFLSREPQEQFTISRVVSANVDTEVKAKNSIPLPSETREYKPSVDTEGQGGREGREERRMREEREERSRKLSTRFSATKPTYDDMPKGKGRDKAKRRQQFLERDEDNADDLEEARRRKETRLQRKKEKEAKKAAAPTPILLPEYITVANLAMALRVRVETFIERLAELGYEETSTDHILNAEDSGLIAMEYNFEAIIDRGESEDLKAREPATDPSLLPQRPPVVTIMGHVDHGKTTLLDWLRKSSVAATEHGGITQHIGAFSVPMPSGKIITFLDTPGHAAFLNMRQRGANVTDIVILVVAADDSVKPQTIEAINHAKAAKVPIIVAINKIDKDEANIDRVKQDLARHGVDVEDFGGDTQVVCVSGKTGQGMEELEEAAVTLSEILDMRAETDGQAEGWVLEASIKSMGKVATVLVRRGTMRPGDFIVAGKTWARIRCLRNEAGLEIESAGPGTPVEIDGWREQPLAGDEVLQAPDESKAKSVIDYRVEKAERDKMAEDMEAINESRKAEQDKREREKEEARLAAEAEAEDREYVPESGEEKPKGPKEVFFIVKGDVSGSVEAVIDQISGLGNKEVQPRILRSGVGQLAEFDIEHAAAAKGHVINFNTPLDPHISLLAERNKVTIIDQNIIYRLVDDVRAELSKHLPPLITQRVLGEAEIAQVFSITVKGRQQKNIAGCKIRNGTVFRNSKVRVLRNNEKVFDGSLASLKNVKKDVQEMKKGSECGMGFENWFDFQVGDLIQSYEEKEEKRYL